MAHLVRASRNRDARSAALAARNELDEQAGARGPYKQAGLAMAMRADGRREDLSRNPKQRLACVPRWLLRP